MSDKPEDPNIPDAWKKPPDPYWKPTQHPAEPSSPPSTGRTVLKVLAWSVGIIVALPVLGVLLLLGTCFFGGGRY